MTVDLFERYRDALRRGHVAAARGELEMAAAAYGEAIAMAPARPVAHNGLGSVHLRSGDLRAALREFDLALANAPRDEVALAGRADALSGLGRRADAAETLDRLSAVLEAGDRIGEALDVARRALAFAEGKARRRGVDRLAARLAPPAGAAGPGPDAIEAVPVERVGATAASSPAEPARDAVPIEPPVDGSERLIDAEDALARGDLELARDYALAAAIAFRRQGHASAAIDACTFGLSLAPDDASFHLALVRLYLDRGWRGRAAEKLLLLGRLAELDGDADARANVCAVARAEFPGNPQLSELCS